MDTFSNKLGLHWIIDATDCEHRDLHTEGHLADVLRSLPDALTLTRVGDVQVFEHDEPDGSTTLAGIVLIAESHFSVHVRPQLKTIHADLFSCKPFDVTVALRLLRAAYQFTQYEESVLERGRLEGRRVG